MSSNSTCQISPSSEQERMDILKSSRAVRMIFYEVKELALNAKVIKTQYTTTTPAGFRVPCAQSTKKKKTSWLTDSIHLDFVISIGFHLFPFAPARCQECQSLTAAVHKGLLSNSLEGAPTSHRPGDAVEYPRLGSSSHLGQRFDLVTSGYLGYVVTHVVTLEICKMLFRYIRHISGHGVLYFPGSERQNAFRARHKRAPVRVSWLQKSVQGSKTPVEAVILHGSLTLKPCRT